MWPLVFSCTSSEILHVFILIFISVSQFYNSDFKKKTSAALWQANKTNLYAFTSLAPPTGVQSETRAFLKEFTNTIFCMNYSKMRHLMVCNKAVKKFFLQTLFSHVSAPWVCRCQGFWTRQPSRKKWVIHFG